MKSGRNTIITVKISKSVLNKHIYILDKQGLKGEALTAQLHN